MTDLVTDLEENAKLDKDIKSSDKIIIYKKPLPIYKKQEWEIISLVRQTSSVDRTHTKPMRLTGSR